VNKLRSFLVVFLCLVYIFIPLAPSIVTAAVPNVDQVIQSFVSSNSTPGAPGVVFKDLNSGSINAANADTAMTAASLYKLFVAQNLYDQRTKGNLNFSQKKTLSDVDGQWEENKKDCKTTSDTDPCVTTIWPSKPTGQSASPDECLPKMIIYSDNICGKTFLDYGRLNGLYNLLQSSGYSHTGLAPGSLQTSPGDVTKLLALIAQNKFVNSSDSQEIYGLMLRQAHRAKIPTGVPSLEVANKTGEIHSSSNPNSHDAAIVKAGGKTYVLVVMTHLNPDSSSDDALIASLAAQLFGQAAPGPGTGGSNCLPSSSASTSGVDFYKQLQFPFYDATGGTGSAACCSGALASVPEPHNGIFTSAAAQYNISPAFLGAIFLAENGLTPDKPPSEWPNFNGQPGPFSGQPPDQHWWDGSGTGARGPFQFIPLTWWNPSNKNGYVNSNPAHQVNTSDLTSVSKSADDLTDAAFAAAHYLAANGGTLGANEASIKNAIFQYNHDNDYVGLVYGYYLKYLEGGTSGTTTGCAVSGTIVTIDGIAYTFPLPLKAQSDLDSFGALNLLPCNNSGGCHWDGSHAYDFGMKGYGPDGPEGAPTVAITDGVIQNVNYNYTDPSGNETGCNSIQFQSKDGFVYWYGHVAPDQSIKQGQQYSVGQQIGEIGQRVCTGNGSTPHLHIDRGSPKGRPGGAVCCRDPGITPIMNTIYGALPK